MCVPQTHLPQAGIQASFILKGEGVWLAVADFLVLESFVLADAHVGQVRISVSTSNKTSAIRKTSAILGSATFYLYRNRQVLCL